MVRVDCYAYNGFLCLPFYGSCLLLVSLLLVIFRICLHFNAGPHQTLGLKMEILWLDMSTLQRWTSSNSGL